MPRVVHFEINADDLERAIKFYKKVFGWEFEKWEEGSTEYWLVMTGKESEPGINGGIVKREHPNATTINTIDVPLVDEYIKKVTEAGGKVVVPKTTIPKIGYLAYCMDTENNVFGIMASDTSAQ